MATVNFLRGVVARYAMSYNVTLLLTRFPCARDIPKNPRWAV